MVIRPAEDVSKSQQFSASGTTTSLVKIPPRIPGTEPDEASASVPHQRIVRTSTKPIMESLELSLQMLLLLQSAASGDVGCCLRLFGSPSCLTCASVISVSCAKPSSIQLVLSVVKLVTMEHPQRPLPNHYCYDLPTCQLLLTLGSKKTDAGGARGCHLSFALRTMSLALGKLGETIPACALQWLLTGVSTCGNNCSDWSRPSLRLLHWPPERTTVCVKPYRSGSILPPQVLATQVLRSHFSCPTSSSALGANSMPRGSSNRQPFFVPLEFHPSIGSKYLPLLKTGMQRAQTAR